MNLLGVGIEQRTGLVVFKIPLSYLATSEILGINKTEGRTVDVAGKWFPALRS